ncbi:hypothetical protein ACFLW4_06595 [Chloroflexota bacterium]
MVVGLGANGDVGGVGIGAGVGGDDGVGSGVGVCVGGVWEGIDAGAGVGGAGGVCCWQPRPIVNSDMIMIINNMASFIVRVL